ncbi:putative integral membrane protein (TIGR00698 family) [Phyllobacterium myrsinacearum]|uniref:YeiH family protein n=1 Tax=Phyllobacterium myrsinacearum TaxID=28101 RepID=UPI00102A3FE5|nr:putative sulfate exporter family transporter [Phyllobacterium myrsinacearum]RZS79879.1 putative integral membrane protein (TIGR00698 family) [Phyllobacterium myrsinacearum]
MSIKQHVFSHLPGLALTIAVAVVALAIQIIEVDYFGQPWIEGLVLAILLGTAIHTIFGLNPAFNAGIQFASKTLLEIAIVMLGASISLSAIGDAGGMLVLSIAAVVALALGASYIIGRALGLPAKLAMLVACGNSICGNSAIVAAAPVIDAHSDDVAASIAFTAALGIFVVLLLPLSQIYFEMSDRQYGIVAGMTVYAVPQVLAATVSGGILATQIGTLVKLIRVLMLGPVIVLLGFTMGDRTRGRPSLGRMVPWFIVGFLGMMACRSLDLIPHVALKPVNEASTVLTIISMAGLGLTVNIRTVVHAGGRVLVAGILSLLVLAAISAAVLFVLSIH